MTLFEHCRLPQIVVFMQGYVNEHAGSIQKNNHNTL